MTKKSGGIFGKFIVKIIVTALAMILVSVGICVFQKNLALQHISEVLTMVSLGYALLCGFICFSGYNNTKDASYMYQRSVQSSGYDERRKIDLKYLDENINLAVIGICSGILCFIVAFLIGLKLS